MQLTFLQENVDSWETRGKCSQQRLHKENICNNSCVWRNTKAQNENWKEATNYAVSSYIKYFSYRRAKLGVFIVLRKWKKNKDSNVPERRLKMSVRNPRLSKRQVWHQTSYILNAYIGTAKSSLIVSNKNIWSIWKNTLFIYEKWHCRAKIHKKSQMKISKQPQMWKWVL